MGGTIAVKEGDLVSYVDAHQLAASLRKTSTLRRGDTGSTWFQVAQNRKLWKVVVYKEFKGPIVPT